MTATPTPALAKTAAQAPACTLVIFGGNGDLTKRLLMPALYNLSCYKLLHEDFSILAVDRGQHDDCSFQAAQDEAMRSFTPDKEGEFAVDHLNEEGWGWLKKRLHFMTGDFTKVETFHALASRLTGNVIFYLAVADRFFGTIIEKLDEVDLTKRSPDYFRRVVIEKPFGHDQESARELNAKVLSTLDESQIYRIDHFLGKETVQNIMALRFGNGIFEPLWNRDHIDSIQITAAETVGVESRGSFYEITGALRDMVPNHMFQLLAMVAMEPPMSFGADAVRTEKAKVVAAIHPLTDEQLLTHVVRGQYDAGETKWGPVQGYRAEPNVSPTSNVETYVALRLTIDNWRWAGVPFYIRTGKKLGGHRTEIAIQFKQAPAAIFRDTPVDSLTPNVLTLRVQPDEGIGLEFSAKEPGQVVRLSPVSMDFSYDKYFQLVSSTGYETLIYDALIGDATLFNRADNIDAGWAAVQPVLDGFARDAVPLCRYAAGSEGPVEADEMLARDGRAWRKV